MKRVRCPKCDNYIQFDANRALPGQKLVFICPYCNKEFAIRMKTPATGDVRPTEVEEAGWLTVIENVFHFRQHLPLHLGDNVIGCYHKSNNISTPIETTDPSVDFTHCVLNVSRTKDGQLRYVLRDGPSNTGTWIGNDILEKNERRVISDGTIFTIGATSLILNVREDEHTE